MKKSLQRLVSSNVSVIVTVLNETKTVESLIESLSLQTKSPRAVIIVDGGSTDGTLITLQKLSKKYPALALKVALKPGNRSVGRNKAVALSQTNWLAFTDAGCIADRNWLEELMRPVTIREPQGDIVSGYFYGLAKNGFEQAVVAYSLTMPRLIKDNFLLPTTRSMLIHRSVLSKLGGFDENLADNEDYALAQKMLKLGFEKRIVFAPRARVGWLPGKTWAEFSKTIYRFARGDAYAGLWRPKVILIFIRYLLGLVLLLIGLVGHLPVLIFLLALAVLCYLVWAILKNYHYAQSGWYYLPAMQVLTDILIILGSLRGFGLKKFMKIIVLRQTPLL